MTKKATILPWILVVIVIVGIGYFLLRDTNSTLVRTDYVNNGAFSSTTDETAIGNVASSSLMNNTNNTTVSGNLSEETPRATQKPVVAAKVTPRITPGVGLPNTGGSGTGGSGSVTVTPLFNALLTPRISVILGADGSLLLPGTTHTVNWGYSGISAQSSGTLTVELMEPYRSDRGPLILAQYEGVISSLPRSISWTVPRTIDPDDWYAIRVTYQTTGTYSGFSQYFKLQPSSGVSNTASSNTSVTYTGGPAVIQNTTQPSISSAVERSTIPLIRFRVAAPADSSVYLTHLAVGSPVGNDVFNYVENLKANVNGTAIPMSFANQYLDGTTIWTLGTPVTIAANSSVEFTLYADVKPGLHDKSFQTAVKGGRANVSINGTVTGPLISVQ